MPAPWAWRCPASPSRCSPARSTAGRGILVSLALLAIPTALLAVAPGLGTFTLLRIVQGIFMASAFTLTLAYLGEECSAADAAGAFAAYITGNVASNLIGRLMSAAFVDHLGLAANFYIFAALNLAGALLVYFTVQARPAHACYGARATLAAGDLGTPSAQSRRCAPASASASASCSPSSAPSPS